MSTMRLVILSILGCLLHGAMGATVASQHSGEASMVRREPARASPRALNLDADGKLIEVGDDGNDDVNDDEEESDKAGDFCNIDFPLGHENENNCSDTRDERIMNPDECEVAAAQASATVVKAKFHIGWEWYEKHPKGCFATKDCEDSPKKVCYWYNGVDVEPPSVSGTPVCKRPRLLNGTVNSKGNDADCPADYAAIKDEKRCKEFGLCLGYCAPGEFGDADRVGLTNASQYHLFPKHCFINEVDGCVYYNKPIEGYGDPATPKGTPICNVTTITHFPPRVA